MNRCGLCPGSNNCVPPDGPTCNGYTNSIVFVGEAPGYDENRKGVPFIGKTGMEVDRTYLPLAGLRRAESYFTNAIKCLPVSNGGKLKMDRRQDRELLESCAQTHLYREIEQQQPKLIVAMGAFACYALDPNINLELHHGMPLQTPYGIVFPMYHPAGGIHEPKKMLIIRTDWDRLRRYIRGTLHLPVDEYPEPDYAEVTDEEEIEALDPTLTIACDTESSRLLGPYCLTYSQQAGTGRLIRRTRIDLLSALQRQLDRWEAIILFHNWLYDRGIVQAMGLVYPEKLIRDTMVRAFHLGNLPKALKVLAYRELGMEMQDFEDLVKPYSTVDILAYYRQAWAEVAWTRPEPELERDKEGLWKMKQPQSMATKLKRFFTDFSKNPNKDIFGMWDTWESAQTQMVEVLGPYPGLDIAHVPFEKVLHYACRDSDATLRIFPILEHMKAMAHSGIPQERWRD